jgi:hypothetical protein
MLRLETERQYLVLVWGPDIITLPFPSFWDTFGQGFLLLSILLRNKPATHLQSSRGYHRVYRTIIKRFPNPEPLATNMSVNSSDVLKLVTTLAG